jgi:LuxR family maltose regulon positive regulatory protein
VTGRLFQARTAVLLGDGATARVLLSEARTHLTPELQGLAVGRWLAETESILTRMTDRGGTAGVLTTTEMRVLQFLPSHLTVQQISEHLFVSPTTVKTHVQSIYRKFGVRSRAAAVAHARALGLVESPSNG